MAGNTVGFDCSVFRVNFKEVVKVYGASDDLIEFEGYLHEEIGGGEAVLAFSNGVLLKIEYDRDRDGVWKFNVIYDPNNLVVINHLTQDEIDDGEYTETALIAGAPRWVMAASTEDTLDGDRLIRKK